MYILILLFAGVTYAQDSTQNAASDSAQGNPFIGDWWIYETNNISFDSEQLAYRRGDRKACEDTLFALLRTMIGQRLFNVEYITIHSGDLCNFKVAPFCYMLKKRLGRLINIRLQTFFFTFR